MALPPVGGQQAYKPATETATGGAYARKFKEQKKGAISDSKSYEPNKEAMASLEELKRERGIVS